MNRKNYESLTRAYEIPNNLEELRERNYEEFCLYLCLF